MQLILASQSPRRRELMGLFRVPFLVRVADIDETMNPALPPEDEVARVSRAKAMAVTAEEDDVVVAADTIVVLGSRVLGKPRDERHAFEMLSALSGGEHQVMTGVTVRRGDRTMTHTEITTIHFRALTDREIAAYIRTGEPMDKAGAYGIQGGAALFASGIEGDYHNVVGLPVCALHGMLRVLAPELLEDAQ